MNLTSWIVVGIAALVILVLTLVFVGRKRGESKKVSFEKPEEPAQLTQEQKSGNYQAQGGFNFASADGVGAAEAEVEVPLAAREERPAVEQPEETPVASSAVELEEASEEQPEEKQVVEPVAEQPEETPEEAPAASPAEAESPGEKPVAEQEATEPEETPAEKQVIETVAEPVVELEVAEPVETPAASAVEEKKDPVVPEQPIDDIAPAVGRLGKLRGRLSRSQNALGQGLMGILSAGDLDDDAWEEIEDTLIMADLGTATTLKVTEALRAAIAQRGVGSEEEARAMLREILINVGHPEMDRSIKAMPNDGKPAVVMMVGVNGTGKTTTTGKLARVLVAMGHKVLLGAADTFRAAAADQLETWGRRVGASTVRGKEGADPASVAFDAVAKGVEQGVDVVLIDTAGRLHTSTDLMDQLGKVKRVVEKKAKVDEVLMVIDATVGQNGLMQARVFSEVVDITGVVLTKLDGTAKGGIVFQVQQELGVPVKLVGLGEGADDLAPFEIEGFVDALLGGKV